MFWEAVLGGFRVFTYWELYVAAIGYVALLLAPPLLQGFVATRWEEAAGPSGCLMLIVGAGVQTFANMAFVLVLSPIILGYGDDAAWLLPWAMTMHSPWGMCKLVFKLSVAAFLCMFIPIVGKWHTLVPTVVGSLALLLLVHQLELEQLGTVTHRIYSFSDGMGPKFGFIIVGTACAAVGTVAVAYLLSRLESLADWLQELVPIVVGLVLGSIPVFMYGAYLGAELRLAH